ncbi:MAG: hypothetical protein IKM20_10850 [Erysipelotrichales bacterium]|nr:hypothetical protein [Erysipelotrichales bacterium]
MTKKQLILGILAILLLAIGSYISFQVALENAIDLVRIPFANKEIYSHYMINEEDIEWREIPKGYVDENILIDEDDIIGKYVSLDSKIAEGSLFYDDYLIEQAEVEALPGLLLKENQIAFPLSMNLLKSSGNTIQQNQKVDVYVTYTEKSTKVTTIDKLLMNVRVIGVKDRNGLNMNDEKASKIPSLVILAINEEYLNMLQLASEIADISIYAPRVDYASDEESILYEESKILPILNYDDI